MVVLALCDHYYTHASSSTNHRIWLHPTVYSYSYVVVNLDYITDFHLVTAQIPDSPQRRNPRINTGMGSAIEQRARQKTN